MICDRCGKTKATQEDWDTIPEGEGGHLCWAPRTCWVSDSDIVDRLREQMAAAGTKLLHEAATLPANSPGAIALRERLCELAAELGVKP